jgi:hypothetical protein
MYYLMIRQFARTLTNLSGVLEKAERYAKGRNFDVNNFITARLAPDMLPFSRQVQTACDTAKMAAANLSRKEAPKYEDTEKSFEELRGRIAKTVAWLDALTEQDFASTTPDKLCRLHYPQGKGLRAQEYLLARQIPNFYFHVTTAYAILRHGGVDAGKTDYLGPLDFVDV